MLRPSINTRRDFENWPANPRIATDQWFPSICATSTPGAIRSASGMLVAPDLRMSSCVITKIAAGVCRTFCGSFETVVTWTLPSSSRLNCFRVSGWFWSVCGSCARVVRHAREKQRKMAKLLRPTIRPVVVRRPRSEDIGSHEGFWRPLPLISGPRFCQLRSQFGYKHFQLIDKGTIPPAALHLLLHDRECLFGSKRLPVRPVCGQSIIDVHHLKDPRNERNFIAFETVGVPRTVTFFVVVANRRQHLA